MKVWLRCLTILVVSQLATAALIAAQGQHDHHSPYADQISSGIAGLSTVEIEQLRNGEGMGLARVAELNRHPGPRHVLDAADELQLSPVQIRRTRETFDSMKKEAIRIGKAILEKEENLSRRFAHRHIDDEVLQQLTREIGILQAELRATHLRAHLQMVRILSDEQITKYDVIRGYQRSERTHSRH